MTPWAITNREALLQQLAELLKKEEARGAKLINLNVMLFVGKDLYWFSVAHALDVLVNDIFWDERGNWSEADRLEIREL